MTVPISSVPAVRAYLYTAISTQVSAASYTEPGVEVYNMEVDHETSNDVIVVGAAKRQLEPGALVGGGGAHWKFERYRIEVVIQCDQWGPNDTPNVVQQRAYAILANVETAIRLDPSLGALVTEAWPEETDDTPLWEDEHKSARCTIACHIHVLNEL